MTHAGRTLANLAAVLAVLAIVGALGCGDQTGSGTDAGAVPGDGSAVPDAGGGMPDAGPVGSDGGTPRTDGGPTVGDGGGTTGPWTAPIGIPMPEFGVNEGVDSTCGVLTPTAFTSFSSLSSLTAGSLVEIPAGVHTPSGPVIIGGEGTPCQPIIVRGTTEGARTTIRGSVGIVGSHVIVEHLEIDLSTDASHRAGVGSSDHVALRHSEIHGLDIARNTTVVFIDSSTHVVLLGNHIHDNGDFGAGGEIDVHGIGASASWDIWIVDNHIHHNRGDGMQFGHQADNTLGRIYIGRNDIHDNGENSVDIKEASNVIVSENTLHGEAEGNVVFHDCPIGAALIYNEVYDATYGVSMPSLESNCDDDLPVSLFVLRNELHDIATNAVQAWGTGKRYYVAGNSFASVGASVEIDNPGTGSRISDDDAMLEDGLAAFEALYGLDIRR